MQYWHGEVVKAKGATRLPSETEPDPEDDPDLLELVAGKGGLGKLTKVLEKKGFVSGAEVDRRVDQRAAQMVREGKLIDQYPDLADKESDFFKQTAVEYGKLTSAGMPKGLAMEQAAKNVRLAEFEANGGAAPLPKAADAEAERQRRIRAQGGDKGRRTQQTETVDTVSDDDKTVAAAMGISEKDFLESRKSLGVRRASK